MPFNIPVLKTRALTAVFFVIIMLAGLMLNIYAFILLFSIIMIGCLVEFYRIVRMIFSGNFIYYLPAALAYIVMPLMMLADLGMGFFLKKPGLPVAYDPLLPCALIFSIWINDTMAYLVGSWIGRTPFSPISPKKTWEGTIGGVILCIITITLLGKMPIAAGIPQLHWALIAAIAAVFGTLGDLFESKLKRMAGIKDSGKIMPGHGGFLDRFDSLLVATPFVWLYVKACM